MNNIKKYRGMFDMTQEELAKAVGVTRTLVIYWENPEYHNLKLKQAKKIAKIFDCSVIDLYGLDNFKIVPKTDEERLKVIEMLYNEIESEETKEKLWDLLKISKK